jgi:hypothetical protein
MTYARSTLRGSVATLVFALAACSTPDAPTGASSASAGGGAPREVTIELHDGDSGETLTEPALFFQKVDVRVAGLAPHAEATLHAAMGAYASEATFEADDGGAISTLTDAPISGTYDEADADGLFWSMEKTDPNATLDTLDVHLSVEVAGWSSPGSSRSSRAISSGARPPRTPPARGHGKAPSSRACPS